ncbi:DUF58 domain-containing protein [Microbacterium invictum]|uniref:Uncharacterized protein (DUF58 family) n=1 Tax=Microbacterium invictum TaxID=515415 RepID=A0AA40VKA4_9MICO|nr:MULTISPECIES: DUF58 domain-containing protein [Microbacterium]MBB4138419.1 uncharacterized protein (DUF58 family) [Microbacterium invictum]
MRVWPLTARGTGAVLLGILCFILAHALHLTELLYVSVLLFAVVAASLAILYLVRRTETVTRAFRPDVAPAGGETHVRVQVDIRAPLPSAQAKWSDKLAPGLHGAAQGEFPALGSGLGSGAQRVELDYVVQAERRGIRPVGPLSVTSTDPFGFARRRHVIGDPVPLTVTPAVIDLGALDELPGSVGGSLHSETNELGQGADNLIPRMYVPGDSMRRIHWRASAHRDELMVRQEEQESTPEATVVFDRGVRRYAPESLVTPGEDPGFEAAVSACASAVARLSSEGYVVTVMDIDGSQLVERIDSEDHAAVDEMAVSFASLTARREGTLEDLVHLFLGTTTGPLVVITGRFDEADAETLMPLVHHSTLPILLTVSPQGQALAHVAEAGWRAAAISVESDLSDAWIAAIDREADHVVS